MRWQRLAIPIYGPTLLASIGTGAAIPLVALTARELGADLGVAALMVGLIALGQLVGDLPAGSLAHRFGEKRALIGAGAVEAVAFALACFASSVAMLGVAVFLMGLAGAVFGVARQSYLTGAVEMRHRAKALSTLGGTHRIGSFVGPFVAAGMLQFTPIQAVYGFGAVMCLAGASLALVLPDLEPHGPPADADVKPPTLAAVLRRHRRVLVILGSGALVISAVRAARQSLVPLWCESLGLDAATTAIVFGLSGAVDVAMFLPGGMLVDRLGRVWGAVPPLLVLGLGFILLPLSHDFLTVTLAACLLGLGNGFSSGIVMTLGADNAPPHSRAQFLGGWRLCADAGGTGGPFLIAAIAVVAPLAVASVTIGVISVLGAAWLGRWIGRFNSPHPSSYRTPKIRDPEPLSE